MSELPSDFVKEWRLKAVGLTFFGVPVETMGHFELVATVGFFADRYKRDPYPVAVVANPSPPEGFTYTVIGGNL